MKEPAQQPGLRRFVRVLAQGLKQSEVGDLIADPKKLAFVLLEVEQMCHSGKSGYIQINVDSGRGIVGLAQHLQKINIRQLEKKWLPAERSDS